MDTLHKSLISKQEIKSEEERGSLCSDNGSFNYPSLDYKYIPSSDDVLDKAFDLLFEEVMKIK